MLPTKNIIIIAGPNGAGKTTFAREFLPNEANCPTFVNADLIAEGLNPLQPEQEAVAAGRMMLEMIRRYVSEGRSFAFETTLSGRTYASMIPRWREQGYRVRLCTSCALPSPGGRGNQPGQPAGETTAWTQHTGRRNPTPV